MKNIFFSFVLLWVFFLLSWWVPQPITSGAVTADTSVATVLTSLGKDSLRHQPDFSIDGVSVENGRSIVLHGFANKPKGGESNQQSAHFVCISCHNIEREDPDLTVADPEARLAYVQQKGLPFLQATTLYGVVNRTSYYNGDYEKKYGDLVTAARHDLRKAIQLCATECAQGRPLQSWEMESVLAYLWTIDLKVADLPLTETELQSIQRAVENKTGQAEASKLLQLHYLAASPATFVTPPENRQQGYPIAGRPDKGRLIYELSCLHCHEKERYSFFNLDDTKYSLDFLAKHAPRYNRYSIYQVGRYGTSPLNGKRAYMPHYTQERMSDQQMEDLRAYLAGE